MLKSQSGAREGQLDEGAKVHPTASVWHLAHVRASASIGSETIIGRAAYVGSGVVIGSRCKVQNLAQIFEPAVLEDGVFVGPGAILTNDRHPRAITPSGSLKTSAEWQAVGVYVESGASIGAGAICVAPIRIGRWAMVAAGAVLSCDAKPYGLYVGAPAKQIGWVGPAGVRLESTDNQRFKCPSTGQIFSRNDAGFLTEEP
jgi:UDP-2-acetamido-3-amino-2,3-dideoxy-glucuronate N-acetyltransferase